VSEFPSPALLLNCHVSCQSYSGIKRNSSIAARGLPYFPAAPVYRNFNRPYIPVSMGAIKPFSVEVECSYRDFLRSIKRQFGWFY
jgi:hypothetical protein